MAFNKKGKAQNYFNYLRRATVGFILVGIPYCCCLAISGVIITWINKAWLIEAARKVLQHKIMNQEAFDSLLTMANEASLFYAIFIVFVVTFCLYAGRFILRHAAGMSRSQPLTLPKAVEFSSAMRKIGQMTFSDQIDCVHKYRMPVYIAEAPILVDQSENVSVKLYPYTHNDILFLESVLATNIGKRMLCLNAVDYEVVHQKHYLKGGNDIRGTEYESEFKKLRSALSIKETDCARLIQEKTELREQLAVFQKKEQTAKARESNLQKGEQKKEPFWRVAGPLIHKLITDAEAHPGIKYTRPQIQAEFEKALERHPDLKPAIADLLETPTKKADKTPFDLDGWGMDFLRAALGDCVSRERGRPKAA